MLKKALTLLLAFCLLALAAGVCPAIEKIPPDPKGVQLCNDVLAALSIADETQRIKALVPLLHKSLLNGDDLDDNVRQWSYKKAVQNVKFYAQPADIKEVHKGNVLTIGYGATAERGRRDKYFVKKKPGQAGMPAPLAIFWPEGGGEPKVIDIGSL